jgi:hypothetical protein
VFYFCYQITFVVGSDSFTWITCNLTWHPGHLVASCWINQDFIKMTHHIRNVPNNLIWFQFCYLDCSGRGRIWTHPGLKTNRTNTKWFPRIVLTKQSRAQAWLKKKPELIGERRNRTDETWQTMYNSRSTPKLMQGVSYMSPITPSDHITIRHYHTVPKRIDPDFKG